MFWGAEGGGGGSQSTGVAAPGPQLLTQTGSLVTPTLAGTRGLGATWGRAGLEPGPRSGPGPMAVPSLASLLIQAFPVISPVLPFSSAGPGPGGVAMWPSSRPSQPFSLLMQLLRLVSSGCQAPGQVSTPCPVLEGQPVPTAPAPPRPTAGLAGKPPVEPEAKGRQVCPSHWKGSGLGHGAPGTRRPGLQGTQTCLLTLLSILSPTLMIR